MIWLLNTTTEKLVRDDEGKVCKSFDPREATEMLDRVNDLKQLNPKHANDVIVLVWDCCP